MSQPTESVAAPVPEPGPGTLLHQARLDRQLSLEEAAQKLRLAPKQLQAIEQDDYGRLPGPTYVRGYLRSYAHLLGLSPETVIARYNHQPAAAAAVDFAKHTPAPQMSSGHRVIKITTLAVTGLILGLTAIWWHGRDDNPVQLRKPSAAKTDVVSPAATPVTPADAVPMSADPRLAAAPLADTAVREFPRLATVPAMPAPMEGAPAPGPRPLVLHFQQESWADVRDGAQNRLLYTTIPAGRVIRLGGAPPFGIYLGNASGVRVEFNGQPVDVSRYQRGPVARFTLGSGTDGPGDGGARAASGTAAERSRP